MTRSIWSLVAIEGRISFRRSTKQPHGVRCDHGRVAPETSYRPEVIRMANVNVTYQEMHAAAQRLKAGQQEISDKLNELQKLVNGLVNGGYVTDSSSKHFEESYSRFNSGATNVIGSLQDMGEYLARAAQTFQDADQHLANSLKR